MLRDETKLITAAEDALSLTKDVFGCSNKQAKNKTETKKNNWKQSPKLFPVEKSMRGQTC